MISVNIVKDAWEKYGFGRPPIVDLAAPGQQVARAFNPNPQIAVGRDGAAERFGSAQIGACCFVFAANLRGRIDVPRLRKMSVVELEANLNAGLWNNDYNSVQIFDVAAGTTIAFGPVGHTNRTWEGTNPRKTGKFEAGSLEPAYDLWQALVITDKPPSALTPAGLAFHPRGWERMSGRKSAASH